LFHVLLSYVLNVVVIDCCLTLLYCAFQPVVALINYLLTYLHCYSVRVLHVHGLSNLLPQNMTVGVYMPDRTGERVCPGIWGMGVGGGRPRLSQKYGFEVAIGLHTTLFTYS